MKTLCVSIIVLLPLATGCFDVLPVVEQWEPVGNLVAQDVTSLLVDASRPATLYAGLENGDLFRSSDQGRGWSKYATVQKGVRINRLIQAPDTGSTLYAATAAGALVSTNRGKTWAVLPVRSSATGSTAFLTLTIEPWNTNAMYAGSQGHGMYRSADAGRTWSAVSDTTIRGLDTADVYDIQVDISHPDIVYAAANLGVLKSTNRGTSWKMMTQGYTAASSAVTHILVGRPSGMKVVYATDAGGIYRSTNGGDSWSTVRFGLEADRILSFISDPVNPDIVYAGSPHGILTSTDFGESWLSLRSQLPPLACMVAGPARATSRVLYAFGGGIGVQRSTDGGTTWQPADVKLGGATVTLLDAQPRTNRLYAATGGTLMVFDEGNAAWNPAGGGILGGPVRSLAFDQDSLSVMYAATSAGLFKSRDGGNNWQRTASKLFMTPLFLDSHPWLHTRMFAAGDQGLAVSTDRGNSWTQTKPTGGKFNVHSITYTPTDAGLLLATTTNSSVISSSDGGVTWSTARYGLGEAGILAVTRDETDPTMCYAWSKSGEGFRSTNGGLEWNRFLPPWKSGDTVNIVFDHDLPSSVVALVNRRVIFFSPSGGGTWFRLLESRLPSAVTSMYWDGTDEVLFAGVQDQGVFRLPLKGVITKRLGR